jgi:hypothetical protein
MMCPMIYILTLSNLQIPQRPLDFSRPLGTQTLLVLFMLEIMSLGTQICFTLFPLLACLLDLMAITFLFFFFYQIWCCLLFIHLVCVGVGDLACWILLLVFLCLHLALVRLISFFVAQPTNHGFILITLLHFHSGVILMRMV